MLNRRLFLVTSTCFATMHSVLPAASAEAEEFICDTIEPRYTELPLRRLSSAIGIKAARLKEHVRATKLTPYGTAHLADRWRQTDGLTPNTGVITLGVHFIDGSAQQRERVRAAAPAWLTDELGRRMAFRFDVPRRSAQIAVTFNTRRNSSYVGRRNLQYVRTKPTMNLRNLTERVIQHEFGHAIGLRHEHQHPRSGIIWNREVVIADMARRGWTRRMVESNIFHRYTQSYACIGDPEFNRNSIMLYSIPRRWTKNFSAGLNEEISDRDRLCVNAMYRI
jgi:hypothetical protein